MLIPCGTAFFFRWKTVQNQPLWRWSVAIGGLAPPKGVARLIYSQLPLLLGTNRHNWWLPCMPMSPQWQLNYQRKDSNVLLQSSKVPRIGIAPMALTSSMWCSTTELSWNDPNFCFSSCTAEKKDRKKTHQWNSCAQRFSLICSVLFWYSTNPR